MIIACKRCKNNTGRLALLEVWAYSNRGFMQGITVCGILQDKWEFDRQTKGGRKSRQRAEQIQRQMARNSLFYSRIRKGVIFRELHMVEWRAVELLEMRQEKEVEARTERLVFVNPRNLDFIT